LSETYFAPRVTLDDFEAAALTALPKSAFEYLAGGSGYDVTLRRNRSAFDNVEILPRILTDVSSLTTKVFFFGREHRFPVLMAPTAFHRLFHLNGEAETIRGVNQTGTTLVASSFSTTSFEDMQAASTRPLWFQVYVHPDRGFTRELVERVVAAGAEAICVTVDLPTNAARDREARAGFEVPPGMSRVNLERLSANAAHALHSSENGLYNSVRAANVTWSDIEKLRSYLRIPLLLKGVLRAQDAITAQKVGCEGVIVSNHGGRALDGVPATFRVLPEIADHVGDTLVVMCDGGIRRGTDVLKALASGAQAVFIGRPYLYGLAVDGASGVTRVIEILYAEFAMAMGLSGCASIAEINATLLLKRY
jgi:4-hydroxymandelate oxidase